MRYPSGACAGLPFELQGTSSIKFPSESTTKGTPPPSWSRSLWMWYRCATTPGTARSMERSEPAKRSSSFCQMRRCVSGMVKRMRSSQSVCSEKATVPASMSTAQPRTSLLQVHSPSPARSFKNSPSTWYILVMTVRDS